MTTESESPLLITAEEFINRVKAGEDWYELWTMMPTNGAFDAAFTGNTGYGRAAVMWREDLNKPEWTIVARTTPPSSDYPNGDWEEFATRGDILAYLKENPPHPIAAVGRLFEYAEGIDYQLPWLLFMCLIGERSLVKSGKIPGTAFTKPYTSLALHAVPFSENDAKFVGEALLAFHEHSDIVKPYVMVLDYFGSRN